MRTGVNSCSHIQSMLSIVKYQQRTKRERNMTQTTLEAETSQDFVKRVSVGSFTLGEFAFLSALSTTDEDFDQIDIGLETHMCELMIHALPPRSDILSSMSTLIALTRYYAKTISDEDTRDAFEERAKLFLCAIASTCIEFEFSGHVSY